MTADFTIDDIVFRQLRDPDTDGFIDNDTLNTQIALINKSELLKSLLKEFQDAGKYILFNANAPTPGGYEPGADITLKDKDNNFVRLLGHELGHFRDNQRTDDLNNFSDIVSREMDESEATATSYIIRRQLMLQAAADGMTAEEINTKFKQKRGQIYF